MPRSATKGRKGETIRTASGYKARVFNGQRAVLFVRERCGKICYEYFYPTLADAEQAAVAFNKNPDTAAHAEAAEPV